MAVPFLLQRNVGNKVCLKPITSPIPSHYLRLYFISSRQRIGAPQVVIAAAIAGYGIAQLPYQVAEAFVRDGRLRHVLGDYTTPVGGLYAVYPSSRLVSPAVKAFIELAAERLAATGAGEDDKAVDVS
jgi:DNA-binding transcriptional LysR family regulator